MQQTLINEEQKQDESADFSANNENAVMAAKPRMENMKRVELGSCFICGSKLHYQQGSPDYNQRDSTNVVNQHTDTDKEVAFFMNKDNSSVESWIINSASSSHMTPQRQPFIHCH